MSGEPTSILAFRNGSLGNTLVAIPALRAIRERYPGARLTVVVDPPGQELLRHCPWIDRLIVYDKRGRHRGLGAWLRLVAEIRGVKPDHAILFKRFFRNGLLAWLSGARLRAGFLTNGRGPFLNRTIPYDEAESTTRLNIKLAGLLGAAAADPRPEIWLAPEETAAAQSFLASAGLEARPFVAAHYGGLSTPPDFLPPSRFADLLRRILSSGAQPVLIGSGERERARAAEIAAGLPGCVIAHGLPLLVTAALVQRARLFLGFNSGPAHIAAAVGTPGLIIFRPGPGSGAEIRKWLPVTGAVRALVPPGEAGDAAWNGFAGKAATHAAALMASAGAAGSGAGQASATPGRA